MRIGNRESGTANWFLVLFLNNRLGYFKSVNWQQGILNRELLACSLFWYILPRFQKCKSGIRIQFPVPFKLYWGMYLFELFKKTVPCSFFTISGLDDLGFCIFHHHVRQVMIQANKSYLPAENFVLLGIY